MRTAVALGEEGVRVELERRLRHPVDKLVWEELVEDRYVEDVMSTGEEEEWAGLVKRCRTLEGRHARVRGARRRPLATGTHPQKGSMAILLRTQAEAYARSVAAERRVVEYRRDILRDALLAPEEVSSFLHRHLIAEAKNPIGPYDTDFHIFLETIGLWARAIAPIDGGHLLVAKTAEGRGPPYGGDPEIWRHDRLQEEDMLWMYSVRLLEGKALSLHRLWELGRSLARDYPWHAAQVTAFVLTGEVPTVPGIRYRRGHFWAGRHDLPRAHRLVLDVDATLSARQVSRMFLELQREMGVAPPRRMTERRATLGRFHMQRLHEGRWRDRMDAWNNAHPQWRYKDERNFRRDALVAYKRLHTSTT